MSTSVDAIRRWAARIVIVGNRFWIVRYGLGTSYIEEAAFCFVNNGQAGSVLRGPTRDESRTRHRQQLGAFPSGSLVATCSLRAARVEIQA